MVRRRAVRRVDEATVRRLGARLLRFFSYVLVVDDWLVFFGSIVLAMAGETDEIPSTPLAILTFLAAIVASMLVRELADQLERGEWP